MLGLTAVAMAGVNDAREMVVCDLDPVRRQRAIEMGADETLECVPDDQFDVVFEMTGNPGVVEETVKVAATGGTIVLVGSVAPSRDVSFSPEQIVRGLMTIRGVHNYRPDDLRTAVDFLVRHHRDFPLERLVEAWFPLADVNSAVDRAEQGDCVRVGVRPERTEDA